MKNRVAGNKLDIKVGNDVTMKKFTCPKCKTPTLSEFNTSDGVVMDFCDSCFGIWFDKDKLADYIELSTDIPELKEMKKYARKTGLICPKCGGNLDELPFTSLSDLLIERCNDCGGTFFDAGEIVVAERVSASLEDVEVRMKTAIRRLTSQGFRPVV